jgi:hypothetical protein
MRLEPYWQVCFLLFSFLFCFIIDYLQLDYVYNDDERSSPLQSPPPLQQQDDEWLPPLLTPGTMNVGSLRPISVSSPGIFFYFHQEQRPQNRNNNDERSPLPQPQQLVGFFSFFFICSTNNYL